MSLIPPRLPSSLSSPSSLGSPAVPAAPNLLKIIKDGKPFEISMIKNYAVKCNIRAKITNYLKQTDKCHKLLNEGVSETLRYEISV